MKKKLLSLILIGSMMLTLVGCSSFGKPTFEDIMNNSISLNEGKIDGTVNVSAEGSMQFFNLDEMAEMMNAELAKTGFDLTDFNDFEMNTNTQIKNEFNTKNDYSYTKTNGSVDIDSNIDLFKEAIKESLSYEDTIINAESYATKEKEYSSDDGKTWFVRDIEDAEYENLAGSIDEKTLLNAISRCGITPTVEKDNKQYIVKLDFTINEDFITTMSSDQKDALDEIFKLSDNEYSVKDILDFYDNNENIDLSIPIDLTLIYTDNSFLFKQKYELNYIQMTYGIDIDGEIAKEDFSKFMGSETDLYMEAEGYFSINVTAGLDIKIEKTTVDGSIPEEIIKNSVEYIEHDFESEDDKSIDSIIEPNIDEQSNKPIIDSNTEGEGQDNDDIHSDNDSSDNNVDSDTDYALIDPTTGKNLYRLVNYYYDTNYENGTIDKSNVIFSFIEPEGWKVDLSYLDDKVGFADTLFFLTNEEGKSMSLSCSVPSGIVYYYEPSIPESSVDNAENYKMVSKDLKTKYNPDYGYDIFEYSYNDGNEYVFSHYYALFYVESDNSFVLEFPWSEDFDSVEEVETFLKENF